MTATPFWERLSLADHVRPVAAGAHVTGVAWLGEAAAFALGDGAVLLARGGELRRLVVHPDGAILVSAADASRLVTGGDDGRVCAVTADGTVETIAEEKGRWIDALAVSRTGAIAWSAGRRVSARDDKGRVRSIDTPSTARGLAFAPKGYRLAISQANGASLWFPNTDAPPEALVWKGAHIDVTWSPDGRYLVTSMQENNLHVWRIADRKDMRMAGYPGKTRSFSWSVDGLLLATSGADGVIVWPFDGKDGPMNRAPHEAGIRQSRVTCVAFNPDLHVVAAGHADGALVVLGIGDATAYDVRGPSDGPVTAIAWQSRGGRFAFGCESGTAGVVEPPGPPLPSKPPL